MNRAKRIELDRPLGLADGLLVPCCRRQTPGVAGMSVGVARVQFNGTIELPFCGYSIPVEIDTYET